uniref:CPSF_A domain-containing protein n=1 Tax=Heterorhabditis bacteriophora TaxID=37862 RepID=A0A1I7WT95_HETBA
MNITEDLDFVIVLEQSSLILRLPERVNEDIQEDPTASRSMWDRGLLNGASQKLEQLAVFYVGDLVTSLQKTSLVPGASECVIYTTIGGAIGILVPFISKEREYVGLTCRQLAPD